MKKIALLIPLFFLYFLTSRPIHAQTTGRLGQTYGPIQCGLAAVNISSTGQNYDVSYCATADNAHDLTQVAQVTTVCRRSSGQVASENFNTCDCHDDDWYKFDLSNPLELSAWAKSLGSLGARGICNLSDLDPFSGPPPARKDYIVFDSDPPIGRDPVSGKYYACWTVQGVNRDAGVIEPRIENSLGQKVCEVPNTNVTPCNYGAVVNPGNPFFTGEGTCSRTLFEYFDNILQTRLGIEEGLPGYKDPTELGPGDLFCSTIGGKYGINTALGCIAFDIEGFTNDYLSLSIGIGGALALLLMLYGFFLIATSGSDPTKIQMGQQIISSVIQGLVIIAISIVLFGFLGINVLGLPGLI